MISQKAGGGMLEVLGLKSQTPLWCLCQCLQWRYLLAEDSWLTAHANGKGIGWALGWVYERHGQPVVLVGWTPLGSGAVLPMLQKGRLNNKFSGKDKRGGSSSSMMPQMHGRWHCFCVFTLSVMFNYRPINSWVYDFWLDALSLWWENK